MLICLRYYEFQLREPWAQGQTIGAEAAETLNRLRAGAIRDTWTKRVPADRLLGPIDLHKLRQEIGAFDLTYSLPKLAPLRIPHTLEAEIRLLLAEGYSGADSESLGRKRFAARMSLREVPGSEGRVGASPQAAEDLL